MTAQTQYLSEHHTVAEAARMMRDLGVGALPVCGDDDRLHGVITEQDVVRRCVAEGVDPATRTAAELIRGKPRLVPETMSGAEVGRVMAAFRIWRVPDASEDEKTLVAMLTEADTARHLSPGRLDELVRSIGRR